MSRGTIPTGAVITEHCVRTASPSPRPGPRTSFFLRLDKDEGYQRGLREWQVKMTEDVYEPEVKEEPWLTGYESEEEDASTTSSS